MGGGWRDTGVVTGARAATPDHTLTNHVQPSQPPRAWSFAAHIVLLQRPTPLSSALVSPTLILPSTPPRVDFRLPQPAPPDR